MKQITFIFFLLLSSLAFSQSVTVEVIDTDSIGQIIQITERDTTNSGVININIKTGYLADIKERNRRRIKSINLSISQMRDEIARLKAKKAALRNEFNLDNNGEEN